MILLKVFPASRRWRQWGGASIVVLVALVMTGVINWRNQPMPIVTPATIKTDSDLDPPIGVSEYVGSQACVACHAERVTEYQRTNHFRTCRVPDAESLTRILPEGTARFQTHNPALHYEMTREGAKLTQTAVRKGPTGEQRTTSSVDLILGAGDIDEVHLSWHPDGHMFELPIAWINTEKAWGAGAWWRSGHYEIDGPPDGTRSLTVRCLECHNTWFEHVPGTSNQYRRENLLTGVSCENCHGPARKHVEFHAAHPDVEEPHAVVRPATLTRERNIEVCTQCHGHSIKHRGPALSYRPGEPLDAYYKTVRSRYTEEDHVANQINYLRQSKCFQQNDAMTCTTCHNPHRTSGTASPARIENSCLNCHQRTDCGERDGLPVAIQDECIKCHMPSYLKINVNFQTEHDDYVPPIRRFEHRIAVHPAALDEVLLNWHRTRTDARSQNETARLTKDLTDYWLSEADDCRHQHRFLGQIAACREALRFDASPATRDRLQAAMETLKQLELNGVEANRLMSIGELANARKMFLEVLRVKPDHAAARGKVGTLYAMEKQETLAIENLQQVVQHDPDDAYGESMLGWLAYLKGQNESAVAHYQRADKIEPYNSTINLRLGMAFTQLNRLPDAARHLQLALKIDPRNLEACQNLVVTLRQQGKPGDAVKFATRTAQLTEHKDLDVLITLADTAAEADQFTVAAEATAQALTIAEANQSSHQADALRKRLANYRTRAAKSPQ